MLLPQKKDSMTHATFVSDTHARKRAPIILMADDDEDDRMMTMEAFSETMCSKNFYTVNDGQELMDYLYQRNKFIDPKESPLPGLILLDLNMPKMNGREALSEIKNNQRFRSIPVVVLSTSKTDDDVAQTYEIGVNSFVTKPESFDELVAIAKSLTEYWFDVVELPGQNQL